MPPIRERYNAKARGSTAGSHKKKGKARKLGDAVSQQADPNAEIVVPKSADQKNEERKERLRQELLAQADSKVNSKKKKRLEKYIEKKLKQEERIELFDKLSKSQAQMDTALHLQSSATLGTGRVTTHKQQLDQREDRDVRRAMDGQSQNRKRKRNPNGAGLVHGGATDDSQDESEEFPAVSDNDESASAAIPEDGTSRAKPIVVVDSGFGTSTVDEPSTSVAPVVGSALQRKPDGSVVAPRISKRKPKSTKLSFTSWKERRGAAGQDNTQNDADSESSFDSSDSANDTSSESGESSDDDNEDGESDAEETDEDESPSDNNEGAEDASEESPPNAQRKRGGFKQWALKQLSVAKSYIAPQEEDDNPPQAETHDQPVPPPKKRKLDPSQPHEMRGPLGEDLQVPSTSFAQQVQEASRKAAEGTSKAERKIILVTRPADVQAARLELPIVAEEQAIMEAVLLNSVVIICGETGSGKTTQVPQFLFEAGFGSPGTENPGMIGITQPRRVAAMSMASRVAHELSLSSSRVSYQIRYDATVSPNTSIKFMTDGVLLRELATDFLLQKYSVVVIDEAHERSMNTDILIGVLSRVVRLREEMWKDGKDGIKPLRLIIMSATLRVSDFAENTTLFPSPPPIINVAARQYPVTVHFNRRTVPDYVNEAIRKASKIHARLPPGGILIFLTGQNEITGVCRKLEAKYGKKALEEKKRKRVGVKERLSGVKTAAPEPEDRKAALAAGQVDIEAEDIDLGASKQDIDLAGDVDDVDMDADGPDDADALDSDGAEDEELGIDAEETETPMHIVPLYALLPSEKQMLVFQPPPEGTRLVVVSTNVAETSLTIPGIRYVIDCGRAKERHYDATSGIQSFQVSWVSKASASQRAGRAGRTGPGHCYRLYSSALYENYFEQFAQPEILRMPIEGVVLQMKCMHIDAVINFPFPTPPDRLSLRKAENLLTHLGALKPSSGSSPDKMLGGEITEIGRAMSLFPLSPRFSRMLVSGRQHNCLPYVIAMVSALSVGDPFLREEALGHDEQEGSDDDEELAHLTSDAARAKEARRLKRRAFFQSQQHHSSLGNGVSDVFRILSVVGAYEFAGGGHKFCAEHFVRPKAMEEIHKLRAQISNIVQTNFPELDVGFTANLRPPTNVQLKVMRQLLAAGFIDQVAVRKDLVAQDSSSGKQHSTSKGVAYQAMGISEDVFIHPSSVLANVPPPDFVVYLEVVRTSRVWIKGLTVVNAAWLSSLGKSFCSFSKPFKSKEGHNMVTPHFGPAGWELPPIKADV